jgi:GH15 family glucan-1,4-alpha-glucosidase
VPRPLFLSNGKLAVGFDARGNIRDLYWPKIGHWNHLAGNKIQFGFWDDGRFEWLSSESWSCCLRWDDSAPAGLLQFKNDSHGLRLEARAELDEDQPKLRIVWRLDNLEPSARRVRFFLSENLDVMESPVGDTAFFHPPSRQLIHFKNGCWFGWAAKGETGLFQAYACGHEGFGDSEGTWRDAEDGELSGNPIAQGSVDSTLALHLELPPSGAANWTTVLTAAPSLKEFAPDPWDAFSPQRPMPLPPEVDSLPREMAELVQTSLYVMLGHCDPGGAILASLDSDIMATHPAHYAYCWPRDGAEIGLTLFEAGIPEPLERFVNFCMGLVGPDQPYFLQKYTVDGHLGATWHPWLSDGKSILPIQEDETAAVVSAACKIVESGHLDARRSTVLIEKLIKPCAEFMRDYRWRNVELPLPSYDLWEERRGMHAHTIAIVNRALEAAERVGAMEAGWGRFDLSHLVMSNGALARMMFEHNGQFRLDETADASSLLAVLTEGDFDKPYAKATYRHVVESLTVRSEVGGIARNSNDYYFKRSEAHQGNPWFITTLWAAQFEIRTASQASDLDLPLERLWWCRKWAATTGVMSEQIHAETGEPLSVSPLPWSHAEFVKTALAWVKKKRELGSVS